MPEILWKAYIDFEIEQEETDRARDLYKRLLQRTQHVKVWLSFAQFELQVEDFCVILYMYKCTVYSIYYILYMYKCTIYSICILFIYNVLLRTGY